MTKKTLLLALLGALALSAPASAAVLPVKTAKTLAKRLAAKQVSTRQIVTFHVVEPRRVSDREIRFAYDDRSAQNVYCTSVIVVRGIGNTAKAAFDDRATVCRGIPDAALAYEAAVRTAVRDVGARARAVRTSLRSLDRSSAACNGLRVPRNRRAQVSLFTAVTEGAATFDPIESPLQAFVSSLGTIRTTDPVLLSGTAAWADVLAVFRSVPRFEPSLCGAVKRWARAHWAAGEAPANYAALKALDARANRDGHAIDQAASHLADLGVFPRTAVAFTPGGLVAVGVGLK